MRSFYDQHIKPIIDDDLIVLCVIFLFALFLRLMFLPHLSYDPAFIKPMIDCQEHNDLALRILRNNWSLNQFDYHTPGYAYFVAAVYKALGQSALRLAVVQYVLGSSCACLVFLMIKRLMNRWAALFGAFLMSTYWFLIYTQSHVFSENLSMPLNLLMIYTLLFAKDTWYKYLLGGLLLGLSTLVRPEILPFAAVVFVWIILKKLPIGKALLYSLLFMAAVALCVLPLLMRNHQLSGEFLMRQQIGVNFYMGSMPEHKGSNIYISVGREWDKVIRLPYRELNVTDREMSQTELNAFYKKKVFDYIKSHPLEWSAFMAGKVFSVLVGIDFLRSEDVYFYNTYISPTLFSLLQTWFICILAVVGVFLTLFKEPKKYALLYGYFGAYLAAMLFTYKTRYLMSHMPLIIIFASYAFVCLLEAYQRRDVIRLRAISGVALALFIGVLWNPLRIVWPSTSEIHYVMAMHYMGEDYDKAESYFKKAVDIDSENVDALRHLGILYMNAGEFHKAILAFEDALTIAPEDQWINDLYAQAQANYSRGAF